MSNVAKKAAKFLNSAGEKAGNFVDTCSYIGGALIENVVKTPQLPLLALACACLAGLEISQQKSNLKDAKNTVIIEQNLSPSDIKKLDVYSFSPVHPTKNSHAIEGVYRFGDSLQVTKTNPTWTPKQVSRVVSALWK